MAQAEQGLIPMAGIPDAFHSDHTPKHHRGVSPVEGLFFIGLPWLSCRGSALMGWVGRDAAYIARHIS